MLIRKCDKSSDGWNSGDKDVVAQLFRSGMVWDGNLASKGSRDHLVKTGYVVRVCGMQSLTGKGILAAISSPRMWLYWFRVWRKSGKNPLIATDEQLKRSVS